MPLSSTMNVRGRLASVLIAIFPLAGSLWALPQGEQVTNGSVHFERNGNELRVIQHSSKAIVNYQRFNIAGNETVRFQQPSSSSAILNRVVGGGASTIAGLMQANGNVFLVNPNGILFTPSARVDVHGLVASSMQLSDRDFLDDQLTFSGSGGGVVNQGNISADFAYLVGGTVRNDGAIHARKVALAAGQQSVKIDEVAGGEIHLVIDGEEIIPPARAEGPGNEEGTSVAAEGPGEGTPAIDGDGEALPNALAKATEELEAGDVFNAGEVHVGGDAGGTVSVAAHRIAQAGVIHADGGLSDGGTIDLLARDTLVLTEDSILSANAGERGAGGAIMVFSQGNTRVPEGARISARGGTVFGDGGQVEFSGIQHIELGAVADVSRTDGAPGHVLIDPSDILISSQIDTGGNFTTGNPPIQWTPSGANSTISTASISGHLDLGDLTISTASGSSGGGQIQVRDTITYNLGADGHTLRLLADDTISFATGTGILPVSASSLHVQLIANAGVTLDTAIFELGSTGSLSIDADSDLDGTGDLQLNDSTIRNTDTANVKSAGITTTSDSSINTFDNVLLQSSGNIRLGSTIQAGGSLVIRADNDLILDGTTGLTAFGGVALCADDDLDGAGDLFNNSSSGLPTIIANMDGGTFIHGANVSLSNVSLQTLSAGNNTISVVAQNNLFMNESAHGDIFAAKAGGDIYLGSPITADSQITIEAGGEIQTEDNNAAPLLTAPEIGLSATQINNFAARPEIDASSLLVIAGGIAEAEFTDVQGTLDPVGVVTTVNLAGNRPGNAAEKPFASSTIDPSSGGGTNLPGGSNMPPGYGGHTTIASGEGPLPPVHDEEPDHADAPLVEVLPGLVLPALNTREGQDIDRGRSAPVNELPNFKVSAVQFSEFYFLHEKMQISEYASSLDLYFIDYLVFGEANVAADSRLPSRAKKTLYFGGPKPFQL
jgi:filamentous hemagglutinin family protein